ncbi:Synaptotagmin-17 [Camelus dromedarius]|uniref:Synaptotagmin-17 n=1 Tax=Camelus dromedarius TaxID=9838 RepID=A0A5N4CWT5_CAMDR|nr:Synaptotagmin-17 [Camelus dromedarius]
MSLISPGGPGPVLYVAVLIVIFDGCLGLESRRPSSPLIDIKPIEFGVLSAKKEPIQPSVLRRTYTPDDYFRKFEPHLYSLDSNSDDVDLLTDAEILSKYQLGMLHFSTQYDLLHNHLTVRVIEARDLPPPISHDGTRQDMAHSNPYVKICLLPDQKNSKQTGVKRKTQKPVFEERYTFEIPFLEAQRRTLLLTVLDFDKFSRHCVIGKVSVPLCEVDLVKGGHWWKALIPSTQEILVLNKNPHQAKQACIGDRNPNPITQCTKAVRMDVIADFYRWPASAFTKALSRSVGRERKMQFGGGQSWAVSRFQLDFMLGGSE